MRNDTTILRFDFMERPPEVSAARLAAVVDALQTLFLEAVEPLVSAEIELFHAVSPRPGSIEFHFRPQINIQINKSSPAGSDWVGKATLGVAVAGLLWTAVFGQNGALHGALQTNPIDGPNEAAELLPHITIPASGHRLLVASSDTGADFVELQIPGNAPIVIMDLRLKAWLRVRVSKNAPTEDELRDPKMASLHMEHAHRLIEARRVASELPDAVDDLQRWRRLIASERCAIIGGQKHSTQGETISEDQLGLMMEQLPAAERRVERAIEQRKQMDNWLDEIEHLIAAARAARARLPDRPAARP